MSSSSRRIACGALVFALACALGLGIAFVTRERPAAAASGPSWCGSPLGPRNGVVRRDMGDCTKLSMTGAAPACVFWAQCGVDHVAIDCASTGDGFCRCDGPTGKLVAYDPAFCALDAERPAESLRAVLDKGAVACRWTTP